MQMHMTKYRFRLIAAWCAILSMFFAFATIFFSIIILNFDANLFNAAVSNNATVVLPLLAENPALAWWPSIFDFFGFYLLLLPLAFYLHHLFKAEASDWMNLFTACGLAYILFGAMGAAILADVFSSQAVAYAETTGYAQQVHTAIFEAFGAAIQRGVWGILDPILAGIWWTGLGLLLRKNRRILGGYTLVLGLINLLGGFCAALGIETVAGFCLNVYFLMAPIWAFWLGITLLYHDDQTFRSLPGPAA
jgi:hypothetical protein